MLLAGCRTTPRDPNTVVFLIESSPANLDPRIGTDSQSERIDELLFDGLVARDRNFHFTPALAQSWDEPDPRTLFHASTTIPRAPSNSSTKPAFLAAPAASDSTSP